MYGMKLALGALGGVGLSDVEQLPLIKEAGFDGIFFLWKRGYDVEELRRVCDEVGLGIQSVHAPFGGSAKMWLPESEARGTVDELLECLDATRQVGAPFMVCHTFIGFKDHTPTADGINNFKKVVDKAREYGIKIAFENTEGREYLDALMDAFSGDETVGFCYDSGHEECYNRGERMLSHYGDRLLVTHINDNLGVKDFSGEITYLDDLHLLPFDGIIDWEQVASELSKCPMPEYLTLELTTVSKPHRHENDKYAKMPLREYLAEAYARAARVATLIKREIAKKTNI